MAVQPVTVETPSLRPGIRESLNKSLRPSWSEVSGSEDLSRVSFKSVVIHLEGTKVIDYNNPIFGELKANQNLINPCYCFYCDGRCFLSKWCKIIGIFEIVISTAGILVSTVILALGEERQKLIQESIPEDVPFHPVTVAALNRAFIVCFATYFVMLIGSFFLLLAAIAVGRDEEESTLLYHSRGWMNVTFIKSCCWVYPIATLLCTLGQMWSFVAWYQEGFLITYGFFLQFYFSSCSVGLFTQIRVSNPPSIERFIARQSISAGRSSLKPSQSSFFPKHII